MDWKNDEDGQSPGRKGQASPASLTYDELNAALPEATSDAGPAPATSLEYVLEPNRRQRHRRRGRRGTPKRRSAAGPWWKPGARQRRRSVRASRTPTATGGTSTTRSACTSPRWARSRCSPASRKSRSPSKIEVTRRRFRRKVLECDYAMRQVVETLKRVHTGELPFDRTIKVSSDREPREGQDPRPGCRTTCGRSNR